MAQQVPVHRMAVQHPWYFSVEIKRNYYLRVRNRIILKKEAVFIKEKKLLKKCLIANIYYIIYNNQEKEILICLLGVKDKTYHRMQKEIFLK